MKFLCEQCEKSLECTSTGNPSSPLKARYQCPGCGWSIQFITNPGEDRFVRSMGIRIGGKDGDSVPFETFHANLVGSAGAEGACDAADPTWTEEAEARLNRAPEFIREVARRATESFARRRGIERITVDVVDETRHTLEGGFDR